MVAVNTLLSEREERHVEVRLGHAEQIRTKVRGCFDDLANLMELDPKLAIDGDRIKAFERACQKVASADRNTNDFHGMRMSYEDPMAITRLRALEKKQHPLRAQWEEHGVTIKSTDDYHANPKRHGYFATHINLEIKGNKGWTEEAEIQVVHKEILTANKHTRAPYELYRLLRERASAEGRGADGIGRSRWLPHERSLIEPLENYIRAHYEASQWEHGLVQLRDSRPVSRNEEEAQATIQEHAKTVNTIIQIFAAYDGDVEALLAHNELLHAATEEMQNLQDLKYSMP